MNLFKTMTGLLAAGLAFSIQAEPVLLKNKDLQVTVSPENGGCVISFKDLKTGMEHADTGGFCGDILPDRAYPGLLRKQAYQLKKSTETEAELAVSARNDQAETNVEAVKKYRLDGKRLHVSLELRNKKDGAQTITYRVQNIFRNRDQYLSLPLADNTVQIIDAASDNKPDAVCKIAGSWTAVIHPQTMSGIIMRFDASKIARGYNWYNSKHLGQELYFKPMPLKKGESTILTYTLEALRNTQPVVAVIGDLAIGLDTPKLKTGFNYSMSLTPLAGSGVREVSAVGYVGNDPRKAKADKEGETQLSWINSIVDRMVFQTADGQATITRTIFNEKLAKPDIPDFSKVKIPDFFPFGDYSGGGTILEKSYVMGPEKNSFRRMLFMHRRAGMNTVTSGRLFWPPANIREFKDTGKIWQIELIREYGFKIIAKIELLHFRPKGSVFRTGEDVLADIKRRGYDFPALQEICRKYADSIILYDTTDEPLPRWLNEVVVANKFWADHVAGSTPISPIFNLSAGLYIPYHAVMYGDAYGAHHTNKGNSDFGYVEDLIHKTIITGGHNKPVWIMLQAFGSIKSYSGLGDWRLPDAAEARLMIWASIAGGAKGIMYHANPGNSPWRAGGSYSDPAINTFGFFSPAWEATAAAGKKLVPLGPLLVRADIQDVIPMKSAFIGNAKSNYRGPAVKLGLRKLRDGSGYLVCVYNNNIKKAEKSILKLNAKNDRAKVLVDLFSDDMKLERGAVEKPFELEPGGGRVWFYGSEEGAKNAVNTVLWGRAEMELELLKFDLDALKINNIRAVSFEKTLVALAEAVKNKKGSEAMRLLADAKQELVKALDSAPDYKKVRETAIKARAELQKAYLVFRKYPLEIFDMKLKVPNRACRRSADPAMDQRIKRMDAASLRLLRLEDKLMFDGKAAAESAESDALLQEAHRLAQEMNEAEKRFSGK